MSGYEFEDFIANLLRQKGFKVTQTDYSNDGGVDLIAEYFKPLFSGKYIVQCKNYTNNLVGQPELRDLYGVVMSENANKGILITTSDFTTQAKNFAKGKNLELINGSILNNLIKGVDLTTVEEPELKFWEYPDFDKKTYDFLKKRLKAGKKNEKNYDNLINFLESYILNANIVICEAGLFEEISRLREEKNIKTVKNYVQDISSNKEKVDLNKLDLCFINGDLKQIRNELIKYNDYYFSEYPSFLSFYCCPYSIIDEDSIFYMDFYKKDPWSKNLEIPSFLTSCNNAKIEQIFKQLCIDNLLPDYYLDESLDNWRNNIDKIVDDNFSNIYSEDELREIVEKYKQNKFTKTIKYRGVPMETYISYGWSKGVFDDFINNLYEAKPIFMDLLKYNFPIRGIKYYNLIRHYFLDKFNPLTILFNSNNLKFTKLGNYISPLFGYPYKLMLYSAYKQIGFEEGCSEMTKFIKIPKSMDFYNDEIPEITQKLCPDFWNDYRNYLELEIKSYNEFLNGALDNIFNPVWHDKYYKKSDEEIIVEICGENWIIDNYLKFLNNYEDSDSFWELTKVQMKLFFSSKKSLKEAKSLNNPIYFNFDNENSLFFAPGFIEMVKCKEGTFIMNNSNRKLEQKIDEKLHKITISKPYLIGKYPVTKELYTRIMQDNLPNYKDFYVINITWTEAKDFCDLLNRKLKKYLPLSYNFDLPTEAQWEYACNSETTKEYFIGSGEMLEWCNDWDGDYPSKDVVDPTGATKGEKRVLRGGNWDKESKSWKTLLRDSATPETKSSNIGFRLAIVPVK